MSERQEFKVLRTYEDFELRQYLLSYKIDHSFDSRKEQYRLVQYSTLILFHLSYRLALFHLAKILNALFLLYYRIDQLFDFCTELSYVPRQRLESAR